MGWTSQLVLPACVDAQLLVQSLTTLTLKWLPQRVGILLEYELVH